MNLRQPLQMLFDTFNIGSLSIRLLMKPTFLWQNAHDEFII